MPPEAHKGFGTMQRREFLRWLGMGTGTAVANLGVPLRLLAAVDSAQNPLTGSIARDWEQIYRDQYKYDRWFDRSEERRVGKECRL